MVRLTDRPDMTLDVYRGRKTITQQKQLSRTVLDCNEGVQISSTTVFPHVQEIFHEPNKLKLVSHLLAQADKPWYNYYFFVQF